jgi:hypothetical protein
VKHIDSPDGDHPDQNAYKHLIFPMSFFDMISDRPARDLRFPSDGNASSVPEHPFDSLNCFH